MRELHRFDSQTKSIDCHRYSGGRADWDCDGYIYSIRWHTPDENYYVSVCYERNSMAIAHLEIFRVNATVVEDLF